jgi:FAD/FMN-containing dehydrogenase
MERYTVDLAAALKARLGSHRLWIFGHLGDGNLHLCVQLPEADYERLRPLVEDAVYQPLAPFRGSVSAEHGIGLEKKPYLGISRAPAELALMRSLKATLDPKNILNPGKVV